MFKLWLIVVFKDIGSPSTPHREWKGKPKFPRCPDAYAASVTKKIDFVGILIFRESTEIIFF